MIRWPAYLQTGCSGLAPAPELCDSGCRNLAPRAFVNKPHPSTPQNPQGRILLGIFVPWRCHGLTVNCPIRGVRIGERLLESSGSKVTLGRVRSSGFFEECGLHDPRCSLGGNRSVKMTGLVCDQLAHEREPAFQNQDQYHDELQNDHQPVKLIVFEHLVEVVQCLEFVVHHALPVRKVKAG
jgi:hypothetical protein